MKPGETFLTTTAVAELLGVGRTTVHRHVRLGHATPGELHSNGAAEPRWCWDAKQINRLRKRLKNGDGDA